VTLLTTRMILLPHILFVHFVTNLAVAILYNWNLETEIKRVGRVTA
jgi:hypothetical protein